MAPQKKTIGIVGAAISGPVFALQILSHPGLRQRFRPIVFEQLGQSPDHRDQDPASGKPFLHTAGAGVGIFANGLYPLFELGLREDLEKISCEMAYLECFRGDLSGRQRLINKLVNAGWDSELNTCPRIFERHRLRELFLGKIADLGGEILWAKKVQTLSCIDTSQVQVVFENGDDIVVDILVGAEGAWSPTRKFVLESKDAKSANRRWPATFTGIAGIYGISSGPEIAKAIQQDDVYRASLTLLDQGNIGALPLEDGKIAWTMHLPERDSPSERRHQPRPEAQHQSELESRLVPGVYDPAYTLKILAEHEAVYHPEMGSYKPIFDSSERIIHGPLRQQVWNADELYYENVVLIGDAARVMPPYTGQGSSLGIEDATCLADSLLNNGDDVQAAFKEYAGRRVPRSRKVDQLGWWSGKIGVGERWWWRWFRDATFSISAKDPKISEPTRIEKSQDWLIKERLQVKMREDKAQDAA